MVSFSWYLFLQCSILLWAAAERTTGNPCVCFPDWAYRPPSGNLNLVSQNKNMAADLEPSQATIQH